MLVDALQTMKRSGKRGTARMDRLSHRTLFADVSPQVARPPAAALDADIGIVHLGLGAFHRAHQAILTQRALDGGARTLGDQRGEPAQCGRARRAPAAGLPLHADRERRRRTSGRAWSASSARRCSHPRRERSCSPGSPPRRRGSSPSRSPRRATATIRRRARSTSPTPTSRRTSAAGARRARRSGWLVRGLMQRRAASAGGLTVLCCDNMASNGRTLHGLVRQFARAGRP